jgi:predicted nuclease of restriction endonuclease-like RecB superfamily
MLTRDLQLCTYDFSRGLVVPDRLTQKSHAGYAELAGRMLAVYQHGIGRRRCDLHRDVQQVFAGEADCPLRRIQAFCKLLDDQSEYSELERRGAAELRRVVFRQAAAKHPLVTQADSLFEHEVESVRREIAAGLKRSWEELRDSLYADVIDFHRLQSFAGFESARDLLSRYNVAQVQAALFSAVSMTVEATSDFKRILRSARLSRLMHVLSSPRPGVWRMELTGPASVLRETRRYGVMMARFLPSLISCSSWSMVAVMENRGWSRSMRLELSSADGLKSHLPAESLFDSSLEADFAEKWGPDERDGWRLLREAEILHRGQKTFVPDFVLQHVSGRRVLMEVVGFWTPEYLAARLETLRIFHDVPILLAIPESTVQHFEGDPGAAVILRYKTKILVKQVLEILATGV